MSSISTPKPTAGISRIPPETLSEIFVQCLPVDSAPQNTQRLLSKICRLWRSLVLATPILWASLDIGDHRDVLGPPLAVIHAHLQRSGTRPFSFTLRAEKHSHNSPYLLAALTALTAARQRWHKVHIKLVGMTQDILDLITLGHAPLLQSMQYDVMEARDFPIPFRMLHCCPRLESFQSCCFGSPPLLPLVDTSLTSLSLQTFLSVSECVSLLHLSPRLSSAKFDGLCYSDSSPVLHLTHPTLSALTALGDHSPTLLAALTLPSLLNLTTEIEHPVTPLPGEWETTLPAFLERSNPTLHQLSLSVTHIRSHELLYILTLTPHLHVLSLRHPHVMSLPFSAALVHALHPPPPPDLPLCPRLQILQLSGASDCPDGMCTAMLRARWGAQAYANGVACLERVDIGLEGGSYDRNKADMGSYVLRGCEGDSTWRFHGDTIGVRACMSCAIVAIRTRWCSERRPSFHLGRPSVHRGWRSPITLYTF
ncbi:hypothetical protein BD779DRAFT_1798457 [Infundibulicybe gibba]|nr:hypothetical protein BD779DRAFT_1798457 [Infundibulicybe gibba]